VSFVRCTIKILAVCTLVCAIIMAVSGLYFRPQKWINRSIQLIKEVEPRLDLKDKVYMVYNYSRALIVAMALIAIIWASLAFCMIAGRSSKCCTSCFAIFGGLITFMCLSLSVPLITIDQSTTPLLENICNE